MNRREFLKVGACLAGAVLPERGSRDVVVEWPEGEFEIDERMEFDVPGGTRMIIQGHKNGTILRLGSRMADGVRKDAGYWKASKYNLLKLNVTGELEMRNLIFDGGCEEAAVGGYGAPPAPWNSVVRIVGPGAGADFDCVRWMAGRRKGRVTLENCRVRKSIYPGFLLQNLEEATVSGVLAEKVDGGIVGNWCDDLRICDSESRGCLSDGFYLNECVEASVMGCRSELSRQGLDIQGGGRVTVNGFDAKDCAIAYYFGWSESLKDYVYPLRNLVVENANSFGCALVYAMQFVEGARIERALHEEVGKWFGDYARGDFMHRGIANPEEIVKVNAACWRGRGVKDVVMKDVVVKRSGYAPDGYDARLKF